MMGADTTLRHRAHCSPLPPEELERFRRLLSDKQAELQTCSEGLSDTVLRSSGEDAGRKSLLPDDAAETASNICEQDLSIDFLGRTQLELEEVARALERIQERSYGVCETCGQPIPISRLEAIPTASSCVPCKALSESTD